MTAGCNRLRGVTVNRIARPVAGQNNADCRAEPQNTSSFD
jgi:hypothetical protein